MHQDLGENGEWSRDTEESLWSNGCFFRLKAKRLSSAYLLGLSRATERRGGRVMIQLLLMKEFEWRYLDNTITLNFLAL